MANIEDKHNSLLTDLKAMWKKELKPEFKAIFKRQYDAFVDKDASTISAEGLPQLYAELELGKSIVDFMPEDEGSSVSPDGNVNGKGKFEKYDPDWIKAGLVFLKNLIEGQYDDLSLPKPVSATPTVIPDDATIALIGDWGTGYWQGESTPSAQVASVVTNTIKPDVVIHLGDVYYYGSEQQYQDDFLNIIPQGSLATFNLNSNHDMYSVSKPYFKAISKPPFDSQNNASYFALTNGSWILVGLDTAYLSSCEDAFLLGSLGKIEPLIHDLIANEQTRFLTEVARQAVADNLQLIVMTHHTGFIGHGMEKTTPVLPLSKKTLWHQVTKLLEPYLLNNKAFWYWGHAHSGYTLKEKEGVYCRCVGHGAIPWSSDGSDFTLANKSNIEWFETTPINSNPPLTVNGFMSVGLNGPTITESFYTQEGAVTYNAVNGVMQKAQ